MTVMGSQLPTPILIRIVGDLGLLGSSMAAILLAGMPDRAPKP
jgi:hypothetical protein